MHDIKVRCRGRRCSGFRSSAQRPSASIIITTILIIIIRFIIISIVIRIVHIPQAAAAAFIAGKPDIFTAAETGNISLVGHHVTAQPSCVNAKDSLYDTALHYCATYGHLDICRLLLQCNADVNATASMLHKPNPLGWTRSGTAQTPLHHATYHGHVEVCRLLLQCKANVDARDCSEQTP